MKRFIVFIGIALVLLGVRYYDSGIYRVTGGKLVVYDGKADTQIFIPTGADVYRIDLPTDFDVEQMLSDCNGKIVLVEDGGRILYAFTPLVNRSVWVHGKRVNMMIHMGTFATNIGIPILKGSY